MAHMSRAAAFSLLLCVPLALAADEVINDVTELNPIVVSSVVAPTSIDEICAAVKGAGGAV